MSVPKELAGKRVEDLTLKELYLMLLLNQRENNLEWKAADASGRELVGQQRESYEPWLEVVIEELEISIESFRKYDLGLELMAKVIGFLIPDAVIREVEKMVAEDESIIPEYELNDEYLFQFEANLIDLVKRKIKPV